MASSTSLSTLCSVSALTPSAPTAAPIPHAAVRALADESALAMVVSEEVSSTVGSAPASMVPLEIPALSAVVIPMDAAARTLSESASKSWPQRTSMRLSDARSRLPAISPEILIRAVTTVSLSLLPSSIFSILTKRSSPLPPLRAAAIMAVAALKVTSRTKAFSWSRVVLNARTSIGSSEPSMSSSSFFAAASAMMILKKMISWGP